MLEQNAGTVSEIAYMVGFKHSLFLQVFRDAFGEPPLEFMGKAS